MRQTILERAGRRAGRALALCAGVVALGACDDLLDVELTHLLTDQALETANTADLQVSSAIALYECGMSSWAWMAQGHEDVMESIAGVAGGVHIFASEANDGECDQTGQDYDFFDQIMGARVMLSNDPAKFTGLTNSEAPTDGTGVYDKLNDGRFALPNGERLQAIAAIYVALTMQHFGEFYCEGALDNSSMVTDAQFRTMALEWLTRADGHITTAGDFTMPNNAAPSARNMVTAIRAQVRWASGDLAGAAGDAATVLAADPDFEAFITREAGQTRRNKIYDAGTATAYSGMLGINDWWAGPTRAPNPATGTTWGDTIPFTGYIFLGVGPNGETLETNGSVANMPVRWADELRDASENPVSLGNGAVPDTRVPHRFTSGQYPGKHEVPEKYTAEDDDIHLATWREMQLIRAEWENVTNNNQGNAINIINGLRNNAGLPTISGAYLTSLTDGTNDQAEVRAVLLEERRREFYSEAGRYWSTKIQNTDMLWFPRRQGRSVAGGYILFGGVRMHFPDGEYTNNPNFAGLTDRGTGCAVAQAPIPD